MERPREEFGAGAAPLDPSEQEGTRGLAAVGPWIEAHRRRRIWFLRLTLGGLGLGLVLIGVGLVVARAAGLAALDWDLAHHPPQAGVRPGAAARSVGPERAGDAVLFVHGFGSSPRDFASIPEELAARGLRARVLRLPGHGTDPLDFERATLADWRAAVRAEFDALAAEFERVHLVGFSMGAALGLELAAEREVASLVTLAPFLGLPYPRPLGLRVGTLAGWLAPLVPWVDGSAEVRLLACREHAAEIVKYRAIPLSAVVEVDALGAVVSDPELLARITEPLLVIAASDDPVTDAARAFAALRGTSSEHYAELEAERSVHVLAWDCDRDQVRAAVVDFLVERAGAHGVPLDAPNR